MKITCTRSAKYLLSLFLMTLGISGQLHAQTETEPNNTLATSNPMAFATSMAGGVCSPDVNDWFQVVLPAGNKSIRLITTASMTTGVSGTIFVNLYNKYSSLLINKQISLTGTAKIDTLDYTCFEGDTFYVHVQDWSGLCKQYSIRCENTANFTLKNDPEVNDALATATGLLFQKDTTGHLASQRYGPTAYTDNNDYYRCVLPAGGKSLRLITSTRMVEPGATGTVFYSFLNKYGSLLINKQVSATTTAKPDTLDYACFEGDTFYVHVQNWSGSCKEYRIRTDYTGDFTLKNDPEVNDAFATATGLIFQKDTTGHLGSQRYGTAAYTDDNDYYRCVLPAGGKSLRLITATRMVQTGATGGVFYNLYNKYGSLLTNKFVSATSVTKPDTLDYSCFEGDTFYVHVQSWNGSCKEYRIRTDYTGDFTLKNDPEVNDAFATATGLIFQKDTTGHLGSQRYGNTAYTDDNDYYRCVLPAGGKSLRLITATRMVQAGATGGVYYNLYNKYGSLLTNKFVSATVVTKPDTLDYSCFEGDTFYVHVQSWNGSCKEYRIRTDYTGDFTLKNDPEVNDAFATATGLIFQKDTTGHLGSQRYGNTAYTDDNDYYRCVLPAGGKSLRLITATRMVQTGATGGVFYNLYNKYGSLLTNKFVSATSVTKPDTLNYSCFEGDTFYVHVQSWNGSCKEYRIRTDYTGDFTVANDAEPNETLLTAKPVTIGRDTTGHLGSMIYTPTATRTDGDDYYRCIMPANGLGLRLILSARMAEPGGTGSVYYYLYNKTGALIGNKFVGLTSTMKADTLRQNCALGDTFYVRVQSWSGTCKEYRLRVDQIGEKPLAKIGAARTGNDFGFVAETSSADWIEWDFGNGKKSGFTYPAQTFAIGAYTVKLKARNTACSLTYTDSLLVQVKGIESYMPKKAGAGGDLLMTVYGGGLDSTTSVKLIKGSTVLQPFLTRSNSKLNTLSANFDLHFAAPGLYDVEITVPGELPVLFPNGMRIDSFQYPACKAEIIGPDRWRINSATTFELKVSNKGNVSGNGVLVAFAYPKSVDVSFVPGRVKLNPSAVTSVQHEGVTYSLSNSETAIYADSSSKPMPITELAGKAYDGYLIVFKLPKVPEGRTVSMPFKATTKSAGNPSFATWTYQPNFFGSCETPHWSNITNNVTAEAIDVLDMAADKYKAPLLFKGLIKATKVSQKHLALAGANAGARFDAWWNGYEMTPEMYGILNSELDEANAFAMKTGIEELVALGIETKLGNLTDQNLAKNKYINDLLAKHKGWSPKKFDKYIDKLNDLAKVSDRTEKFKEAYETAKNVKTLLDKINTLQKLAEDCPELEPQLIDLLKLLDEELDPKDPNNKTTQSVTSMDPNAIYGPEGVLAQRYRRDGETMHYMITCENMDTATAAAQVVRIVDTLDKTKFDLSTFEFGNVQIGGKSFRLLSGRDQFYGELSLYPQVPLKARIIAKLDTASGIITWNMIGIDTATGNLPTDPFLGLLPPNTTAPLGEAGVNYSVKLKSGLPSGTVIPNTAVIYFDDNAPIATNTWSNTLDFVKPVSRIVSASVDQDTLIRLRFSGTDNESGIAKYRVFVHSDTAGWVPVGISTTDTMTVTGERGRPYSFYVTSIDHVGNTEDKTPAREIGVGVPRVGGAAAGGQYSVYPNPSTGELFIRSAEARAVVISVTDITGRQVAGKGVQFAGNQEARLDLSPLSDGIYVVTVTGPDGAREAHKVILTRSK